VNFEIIDTPRIRLRKITPEVYNFIFSDYNNEELKKFLGFAEDEQVEKEREKHKKGLSTYNRSFLYFQLLREDKVIGTAGFHTWYFDHARAEIFYVLRDDAHKRQGIMRELMPVLLNYGFNAMNLHRIEAMTAAYNIPSIRLLQKAGFRQEGHLREHYLVDGKMEDSLIFSLLKSEFIQ
jgi:ribosomal-protein-alanine N-acetyltransferase